MMNMFRYDGVIYEEYVKDGWCNIWWICLGRMVKYMMNMFSNDGVIYEEYV